MPRLLATLDSNDMETYKIAGPGTFTYSAIRPEKLGATEYTLVTIICDNTGSVSSYASQLKECILKVIDACKKNPKADNLLVRLLLFNTTIDEIHGFCNVNSIDTKNYPDLNPTGMTALYDAVYSGIGATIQYSETLMKQNYDVNGAVYIITDGCNNAGTSSKAMIANLIEKSKLSEVIESLITVLVGVINPNSQESALIERELKDFQQGSNITQFINIGEATPGKLAKLAEFISRSVSSQSQSLGTGSASQPLQF